MRKLSFSKDNGYSPVIASGADMIEAIVYEALAEYIGKLQENDNIFKQIAENNNMEKKRKEKDIAIAKKELQNVPLFQTSLGARF